VVYTAFVAGRAAREGFAHHLGRVVDNVRRTAHQARPSLFEAEVERAELGTFPSQHEHCTVPVLVATLLALDGRGPPGGRLAARARRCRRPPVERRPYAVGRRVAAGGGRGLVVGEPLTLGMASSGGVHMPRR
jgi:hypothetical protein